MSGVGYWVLGTDTGLLWRDTQYLIPNTHPLVLHGLDQHLRNLRPRKLHRWDFAGAEHVADLGAAQGDAVLRAVRAGLGGGHSLTHLAPEAVLELERGDAQGVAVE